MVNPDQMNQSYSLPTTSSKEALESESPTPSPYSKVHSSKIVLEKMRFILVFIKKTQNNPTQKKLLMGELLTRLLLVRALLMKS